MTDASSRPEARSPRGFADRRGADLIAERRLVARVSGVYERWGFEPLETGAFEYADALGKFLPDADRPNEGVFALQDDDDQWMALRYDLTAPLARFAAQGWETLPKPFRRYAFGPVWRNEKPLPRIRPVRRRHRGLGPARGRCRDHRHGLRGPARRRSGR